MIVDTSALLAIVKKESEATRCRRTLEEADRARLAAGSLVEAFVVVNGLRSPEALRIFQELLAGFEIEIVPTTERHAYLARDAYLRFGKGFHPAGLNFGDCFAYTLAKQTGEPLLFVGNDFGQTDIDIA